MKNLLSTVLSMLFLASCTGSSDGLNDSSNQIKENENYTEESQHICPFHNIEMLEDSEGEYGDGGYFCTACYEEEHPADEEYGEQVTEDNSENNYQEELKTCEWCSQKFSGVGYSYGRSHAGNGLYIPTVSNYGGCCSRKCATEAGYAAIR